MTFQTRYKGSLVQGNNIDDMLDLCQDYREVNNGRAYDILDSELE